MVEGKRYKVKSNYNIIYLQPFTICPSTFYGLMISPEVWYLRAVRHQTSKNKNKHAKIS